MASGALLERGPLLDELAAHLRSVAAAGQGVMLLLGGEAGIGKTSLVRRFSAEMADEARVLLGACDPMSTPRALGPVVDIAMELGGALQDSLQNGERREAVFSRFLAALQDPALPTLAVIEDAHWADEATLDLLRFLGRRLDGSRTLVLVTYRDDEVGQRHPLRAVLGDLATTAAVRRLSVPPLSLTAVAELAIGSGLDATQLHKVTGGNPFFVTEVVAAGATGMPATVRDAVASRTARLSEGARSVLETASVIGPTVDPLLLTALGSAEDATEACLFAGLLEESGDQLAFRHELVRDAVYASLSAPRRRSLHRLVLVALEERATRTVDLASLAHHAAGAGDADAVLRHARAAARRAAELGAHTEAHAHYERAVRYAGSLPSRERAELLEAYASECAVVDELSDSIRARSEAAELWRRAGEGARHGQALAMLAANLVSVGETALAAGLSEQAVAILEGGPRGPELAWAYRVMAHLKMLDRETDAALEWGAKAVAFAEYLGDAAQLSAAHNAVGSAALMGGREGAAEHFARSIELGRRHDIPERVAAAYSNLGSGCGELHRFAEASVNLERAIATAEEHDLDFVRLYSLSWLALVRMYQGAWDESTEIAQQVLNRPRVAAISRIMALVALGRVRARRGDPEAWDTLDEALTLGIGTGALQRLAPVRAARAEAAALAGERDMAGREATSVLAQAAAVRHPWFVGELSYWRWLAGVATDLPEYAAVPFAHQIRGRPREAATAWEELGAPYEAARALSDSRDEADLRDALDAFIGLGARPAATQVARRLRELGARGVPRVLDRTMSGSPTAARRAAPLTAREVQVLVLVADGLRNHEIAQRHGVSVRTVDHQVSSILAKLEARTRTEATVEAQRLGLLDRGADRPA